MISPVWRYSLENFPITTLNKPPLSTIARCFMQEGVGRVVRIDLAPCSTKYDVFVLNPERKMPDPAYEQLGETRITVATEVVHPLPVREEWVTCNVTWEGPGFRILPTPSVCYPEAMTAPGQPCPYDVLLAVCRPHRDIARRERRTDVTDLGPRWGAPHISTEGLGMYTWFEFINHHGVEWGSRLWELGDKPTPMQDVKTITSEVKTVISECQTKPEYQAVLKRLYDRLRSVPTGTSESELSWKHEGKCSPDQARVVLHALDDIARIGGKFQRIKAAN
jgi:hypothetical protein